jgi:2-polyprenyl-3-methyl-5-hydroxy-6-metoxy-1,4-benzoquinol methylase
MSESVNGDPLFPERFVPEKMHGLIEVEHLARYIWASNHARGRRVLDAACGVGYGSLLLHGAGAASVTGVDIAEQAIDEATARAGRVAQFVRGDISALPFEDASFDLVVCFETIEHVVEQERALDELRRVLSPEGLLMVSSPNRDVYEAGNPHHTREYTPEELRSALGTRFANLRLERQHAWLAAVICDDETLADADPQRTLDLQAHKVAAVAPGRETFTLALASDVELPSTRASAVLTGLDELAEWRERARSAEEHVENARLHAVEGQNAYESLRATHASLRETYDALLEDRGRTMASLEDSEGERLRLEQSLNRASTLLAERNAALTLANDDLHGLQAQVSGLHGELDASRRLTDVLTTSLSWRVTAPLRALARALRR